MASSNPSSNTLSPETSNELSIEERIAANLEQLFSQRGFAEPSVAELKAASGVTMRTLYRYFPAKEAMVIGALEHRQQRYLAFLRDGLPEDTHQAVVHIFERLAQWMREAAPNGCMSSHALSAFPDNSAIQQAVTAHKQALLDLLQGLSSQPDIGYQLLIIHEGASAAWPLLGPQAIEHASQLAQTLIENSSH
ncbi:TetR/AcrR family transcriptional regulator [Aliagarivorans marinus]|uniref:TetR/AcrR family transcriptional regulator n=1 Tax=Aliagarivorans marinus TaxID=561965 RepID=UPI000429D404|nr:TetR/AcrR family transcriptional regulator [Aliagarivorans marinus]